MKLITRDMVIRGIVEVLRQTYGKGSKVSARLKSPHRVIAELSEIGNPTRQQVREIMIGWPDWTENRCDECKMDREVLIRFEDDPEHHERWVDVCPECISAALKKLQ